GVGLVLVPLNRLTDEHEDLYSRDPVATFSSLFTSSGKVALVESIAYRRHYPDFPYFWQAPRRSWARIPGRSRGEVLLSLTRWTCTGLATVEVDAAVRENARTAIARTFGRVG